MNYFKKWLADLTERQSMSLPTSIYVEGIRDKVLGPRSDYAKIEVLCEPSDQFAVSFDVSNFEEAQKYGYLEWAILGMIDILMTEGTYPLLNMRLTVKNISIDPIKSNQMAFRHAGRDAARNIFKSIKSKLG